MSKSQEAVNLFHNLVITEGQQYCWWKQSAWADELHLWLRKRGDDGAGRSRHQVQCCVQCSKSNLFLFHSYSHTQGVIVWLHTVQMQTQDIWKLSLDFELTEHSTSSVHNHSWKSMHRYFVPGGCNIGWVLKYIQRGLASQLPLKDKESWPSFPLLLLKVSVRTDPAISKHGVWWPCFW